MARSITAVGLAVALIATAGVIAGGGCGLDVTGAPSADGGASTTSTSASTGGATSTASSTGGGSTTSSSTGGTSASSSTSTTSSSSASSSSGGMCPPACTGGCPGGVCEIKCDTDTACKGAVVTCAPDRPCRVLCSGGTDRCKSTTINCPEGAHACEVRCAGNTACNGNTTKINCGTAAACSLFCSGTDACVGTLIARSPTFCIECNGTAAETCKDMTCSGGGTCKKRCLGQGCGGGHFGECGGCDEVDTACPALP